MDKSKLKTSVIITCHNYGRFLKESIDSVINQTKKSKEIIIVNDGSDDETEKISLGYGDNIKYFKVNFLNAQKTRNYGLENSTGEYVLFLDADDYLREDYLEKTEVELDNDKSLALVYCDRINFGDQLILDKLKLQKHWETIDFDYNKLKINNYISLPSLIRKSKFNGFDDSITRFQDWDAWLTLLKDSKAKRVSEPLFFVRFHGDNLTLKKDELVEKIKILTKHCFFEELEVLVNDLSLNTVLIKQKEEQINSLLNSNSWKVTAPLRFFGGKVRRIVALCEKALFIYKEMGLVFLIKKILEKLIRMGRPERHSKQSIFDTPECEYFMKLKIIPFYLNPYLKINKARLFKEDKKIAVHLHLYFTDMKNKVLLYLNNIPYRFDLFVSINKHEDSLYIENFFKSNIQNVNRVIVEVVPNRGRDVSPLIIQFGKRLLKYDVISHIHTKKSERDSRLNDWFESIMNTIYGSKEKIFQIINILENDGALVFPEGNTNIVLDKSKWTNNYKIAETFLKKYTKIKIKDFDNIEFPQGTMFWARSDSIKKLLNLKLNYNDFPKEPLSEGGTLAHAIERTILLFVEKNNRYIYRVHDSDSLPYYEWYEEQRDYSSKIGDDVRVLSYYLPQFHSIPENDLWHEKGFTEWNKVRNANPLFCGHYQQHIPHDDIGYYELDYSVLKKQSEMMKKSGVFGQIFYHYWFNGKLILEKPSKILLENKDIEMPFCFCWANENWTKKWDGNDNEVLLKQEYSEGDAIGFIEYLLPFLKDSRYIKINDRPVLFIYRPSLIKDIKNYIKIWNCFCKKNGISNLYIVAVLTRDTKNPDYYNMDAGVERVLYDWTGGAVKDINHKIIPYKNIKGSILDYNDVANFYMKQEEKKDFTYFRSIVPIWDNSARYGENGYIVHNFTIPKFQEWLENVILYTQKNKKSKNEDLVVINAWNEWSEGAHLEPDSKFGYAYLNSVGRALSNIKIESESFSGEKKILNTKMGINLFITKEASLFLKNNPCGQEKFFRCLLNTKIFNKHDVYINDDFIAEKINDYYKDISPALIKDELQSDYDIIIGQIGVFSGNLFDLMIGMSDFYKESVICANFILKESLSKIKPNNSVSNDFVSSVRLYPRNINKCKNYKQCPKAVYFCLLEEKNEGGEKSVVSTIIRYHKGADENLLRNALLSLLSQNNCIVQPIVAMQDLSSEEQKNLFNIANEYPWNKNHLPILKNFKSKKENSDLRSKMLNESLRDVKTQYAAFLDYDDLLFPFAYDWVINRIKKTGKAVSFGRTYISEFYKNKMMITNRKKWARTVFCYEEFLRNNHAPIHSFVLNLDLIDLSKIKYFDDMKYMEDHYLTMQIFNKDNTDWDSQKLNFYIGDYIHSIDMKHTLAIENKKERDKILNDPVYKICEQRKCLLREKLLANK